MEPHAWQDSTEGQYNEDNLNSCKCCQEHIILQIYWRHQIYDDYEG